MTCAAQITCDSTCLSGRLLLLVKILLGSLIMLISSRSIVPTRATGVATRIDAKIGCLCQNPLCFRIVVIVLNLVAAEFPSSCIRARVITQNVVAGWCPAPALVDLVLKAVEILVNSPAEKVPEMLSIVTLCAYNTCALKSGAHETTVIATAT